MSRGFGLVQQRIIAAYNQQPQGQWTVEQLAAMVYPGAALGRAHKESVRRALAKLGEPLCTVAAFVYHRETAGTTLSRAALK